MDLDQPQFDFVPPVDRRPVLPEPPPVRLVAVEDVTLCGGLNDEAALTAFYVGLLRFERDARDAALVFRAENVRLRFDLQEQPVERDDLRAVGIDVPSLRDLELLLVEREIPFVKERGLTVGLTHFLLRDPAGNWIRIGEVQRIL